MFRLAILSDIHADLSALEDALRAIDSLGVDAIVCAGDLVDYGLYPNETLALLAERAIPCIRGNHDRWAIGRGHAVPGALLAPSIAFLTALPTQWEATFEGVRVAVRHGTPRGDMEGIDPNTASPEDVRRWMGQAQADVLVVGHTHVAFTLSALDGGLIVNPASLLRDPAPGQTDLGPLPCTGTFGVLELPSRTFTVHRAADGAEIEIPRITAGVRDRRGR